MDALGVCGIGMQPSLEVPPEVLDGVEIRGLCWPVQDLDLVVLEPFLSQFGPVLGVAILLKNKIFPPNPIPLCSLEDMILQNISVE